MSSHAYERELQVAKAAAHAASEIIAGYMSGDRKSWDKAEDSPVTQADLDANDAIVSQIAAAFPDDVILSEETVDSGERLGKERVWIVDPLDGTKEFIDRVPEYAVSVALTEQGKPVVGVIQQPETGECFWGARGAGAWLDSERISISTVARIEDAVMLSSRTEMKRGHVDRYKEWFREVRPVGSVALKLALTAAARGDLWLSMAPKSEWDVCGGDLLIREAGGIFVTVDGGERTYNQEDILLRPIMLAGPRSLVDAVRQEIGNATSETDEPEEADRDNEKKRKQTA